MSGRFPPEIPQPSHPHFAEVMRELAECGHGEWILDVRAARATGDLKLDQNWADIPGATMTVEHGHHVVIASFDLEVDASTAAGALVVGGARQEGETMLGSVSARIRHDSTQTWVIDTTDLLPVRLQLQARRVDGFLSRCLGDRTVVTLLQVG